MAAVNVPPSPDIERFLNALLAVYPDLGEDGDEDSPWATGPLRNESSGDFIHFAMTYPGAEVALENITRLAHAHGLVVFDPQEDRVLLP